MDANMIAGEGNTTSFSVAGLENRDPALVPGSAPIDKTDGDEFLKLAQARKSGLEAALSSEPRQRNP